MRIKKATARAEGEEKLSNNQRQKFILFYIQAQKPFQNAAQKHNRRHYFN